MFTIIANGCQIRHLNTISELTVLAAGRGNPDASAVIQKAPDHVKVLQKGKKIFILREIPYFLSVR
jgi:hypothetical protein